MVLLRGPRGHRPTMQALVGCLVERAVQGQHRLTDPVPAVVALNRATPFDSQAVRAVLQHGALRRRLGIEGRRTVERHYSWDGIGESMLPPDPPLYEGTD